MNLGKLKSGKAAILITIYPSNFRSSTIANV